MCIAPLTGVSRDKRQKFERSALEQEASLRRSARRLAGDSRAEDLVQETFLRALLAWESCPPSSNIRAWMHQILRNTFINEYRRLRRESPISEEPAAQAHTDGALRLDLDRALSELPEILRETLLAVDVEGLGYREAAIRTEAPIGTVMSRLARARGRMAVRLAA